VHVFSFVFLIIISGLFAVTFLCVPLDSTTLWHLPFHTLAWACVCTIFLWFECLRLCILSNANINKLCCISLNIHSLPKWGTPRLSGQ
jgi:hypothetical protein